MVLVIGALALGLGAPAAGGAAAGAAPVADTAAAAAAPAADAALAAAPLPQLRPVRMGLILGVATASFYIAQERGWFTAEGIDWQYEPLQVTSEALAQVATGNLEVANVTVGAAVLNSLVRGLDVKVIAGNTSYPPSGPGINAFMVRKDLYDSGVTDASGLRGRRVGGNSLGVFTEYAIDRALATAGLGMDDIEFVQMPFADIPAGFSNRAIDAAFTIEPAVSVIRAQNTAVTILPDWLRGAQETVLMGGPAFLRDRPLAEAFLRVYLRGVRALQAEGLTPDNAALVERYTRVSADLVRGMRTPYVDPDGRVNWDSLMDQQRFYMARGSATYQDPIDLERALSDDGPRQAALASLGSQ
jgi:NitT/TauT family transport system substrate-binding protein